MTAKSWPVARTLRSAVAAAINEAWRNERRPSVAMTGPTRAGDKSTTPRYGVTLLRWGTGFAGEHGLVEKDLSSGEAHNYSMEVRSDPFESAKSHFFATSGWGEFFDVTLTFNQSLL